MNTTNASATNTEEQLQYHRINNTAQKMFGRKLNIIEKKNGWLTAAQQ